MAAEQRVQYHVLYWEGGHFDGVQFQMPQGWGRKPSGNWPGLCDSCGNISGAFKCRVDNMQSTLRCCVDTSGLRFRDEIADFTCLSPRSSIRYNLRQFQSYIAQRGDARVLTEEVVIGAAIRASRREEEPSESGVAYVDFGPGEIVWKEKGGGGHKGFGKCGVDVGPWRPEAWLHRYMRDISSAAERKSGIAIGLMLDKNGAEVCNFGIGSAMFAHNPELPIREVVILLGGPHGIEDVPLQHILKAFDATMHHGTLAVKLPGGLQHSYVALGDLLNSHDRGHLVPILEDCRLLNMRYRLWYDSMRGFLMELAACPSGLEEKRALVQQFLSSVTAASGTAVEEKGGREALQGTGEGEGEGEARATPLDVDRRVTELVSCGLLPRRLPWRARQLLRALEPRRLLTALRSAELRLQAAVLAGCPVADPWADVASQLDKLLSAAAAAPMATEAAVGKALTVRAEREAKQIGCMSGSAVLCEEARKLRALPCEEAVKLVHDFSPENGRAWPEGLGAAAAVCELQMSSMVSQPPRSSPFAPSQAGPASRPLSRLGRPRPPSAPEAEAFVPPGRAPPGHARAQHSQTASAFQRTNSTPWGSHASIRALGAQQAAAAAVRRCAQPRQPMPLPLPGQAPQQLPRPPAGPPRPPAGPPPPQLLSGKRPRHD